jgi:hypothetical protein
MTPRNRCVDSTHLPFASKAKTALRTTRDTPPQGNTPGRWRSSFVGQAARRFQGLTLTFLHVPNVPEPTL